MTKVKAVLQVPARKVGSALPRTFAIGDAVLDLHTERTPNGGSRSLSFIATWSKGTARGEAHIEVRPLSKTSTEIAVQLKRPPGGLGLVWLAPALRRLGALFAQGLAYEIETRTIEEVDAFDVRRTTAELVRARSG